MLSMIRGTLSVIALTGAVIAALGQLGRRSERFDAINIFLPYWVIPALIAAILTLIFGWRRRGMAWWAGGIAIILLAAGPLPLLFGEWLGHAEMACAGERLRVVQFNVFKDNRMTLSAARWIRLVNPDLVLVEEARNPRPVPALLRDRYPFQQSCIGPSLCSTMILAKRRPLASGGLARADPENRGALSAAWMRIDRIGETAVTPFTVVAVHLGRPWPFRRFEGDRAELTRFVGAQPSTATLVAGDFNLPGWSFQLRRLEKAMKIERRSHNLSSWPGLVAGRRIPVPLLPIDQVFAGKDWSIAEIRRGPFLGSDHYPLVVDLQYCPKNSV